MNKPAGFHIVIPCAGSGSRLAAPLPKQYLTIGGQTVLDWTLQVFCQQSLIKSIRVVHMADDQQISAYQQRYSQVKFIAGGGSNRAQTVLNGLNSFSQHEHSDWVLVHDAARCCLHLNDLTAMLTQVPASNWDGAILATAATDTIKQVTANSLQIATTIDRSMIYLAQTPQMFRLDQLQQALTAADLARVTDEASAMEQAGFRVGIVPAKHPNLKITYPQDLEYACWLLRDKR